jgi:hypothetical protein
MKKDERKYYVPRTSAAESSLRNGTFIRSSWSGDYAQYMNGDFIDLVDEVPVGFVLIDTEYALSLIPKVCGGKA